MKIVFFVKSFPKTSETFIINQVEQLKASVFCQIKGDYEYKNHDKRSIFYFGDIPFLLKLKRKIYNLLNLYFDPISNRQKKLVEGELLKGKYDIALIQYGSNAIKFGEACKKAKVPFVIHFHGYDVSALLEIYLYKVFLKKSIRDSKSLVVVNSFQKRMLIDKFKVNEDKITIIPCGVNLEIFKRTFDYNNKCVFIMVGRLTPKKGPLLTLKAFELCAAKINDVELVIIGDGPLKKELLENIKSSKFSNKITYLGKQNSLEIKGKLNTSDVFLQHSVTAKNGDQEGWPISIAEACAMGLPIISTVHSGIQDQVIQGKNGFLVEEYDYKSMGEYMFKLASNIDLRKGMGEDSRRLIEKNGCLFKQISKLETVLSK